MPVKCGPSTPATLWLPLCSRVTTAQGVISSDVTGRGSEIVCASTGVLRGFLFVLVTCVSALDTEQRPQLLLMVDMEKVPT